MGWDEAQAVSHWPLGLFAFYGVLTEAHSFLSRIQSSKREAQRNAELVVLCPAIYL